MPSAFSSPPSGGNDPLAGMRFVDAPTHPQAVALLDYWKSKRQGRPMADRQDIVPGEIRQLLPNICIVEILDEGRDFRIRLYGTGLVDLLTGELTGMTVSEMGKKMGNVSNNVMEARIIQARWFTMSRLTVETAAPTFAETPLAMPNRVHVTVNIIGLPLTAGDDGFKQIMTGFFPTRPRMAT